MMSRENVWSSENLYTKLKPIKLQSLTEAYKKIFPGPRDKLSVFGDKISQWMSGGFWKQIYNALWKILLIAKIFRNKRLAELWQ